MTWSRFDDGYDEHEKIEEAWFAYPPTPVGLHVIATTACNRWQSDGVIKPRWLLHKLPTRKTRDVLLADMVTRGLFDHLNAGEQAIVVDQDGNEIVIGPFPDERYVVHDFLDRHDSSVQLKDKRSKDARRKRDERAKSQQESNGSPFGVQADSVGTHAGARDAPPRPRPVPTQPVPTQDSKVVSYANGVGPVGVAQQEQNAA